MEFYSRDIQIMRQSQSKMALEYDLFKICERRLTK